MPEVKIIPVLGRKTSVPADDPSLFKWVSEGVALTHDVGGLNFDLERKKSAASKSFGYTQWSTAANAQATKCLGLFELYDGTNRDHIMFDNGKVYEYGTNLYTPVEVAASPGVTFANDNKDIYSIIRIGSYIVFADRAEHTPYKWKNGDANLSKLIASGTEYKFRYLVLFQRRVVGLYSDQTDGRIDVRYSTAFPTTAITSLNFPAANQLYIPNDDTIMGGATMGQDRCYIYCDNSIQQLIYYPDYEAPFRLFTVVADQGCAAPHSIVTVRNSHFLFNKAYGFCEYRGGNDFPWGGRPISEDIEEDIEAIPTDVYDLIVGTFIPLTREIVWTVPFNTTTPSKLFYYGVDTGQWRIEDRAMRYVSTFQKDDNITWNDLIAELGGTGSTWALTGRNVWLTYLSKKQKLVYANTDGKVYQHSSEGLDGSALDGHRIEPVMSFGDPKKFTFVDEIWFDVAEAGTFSVDVSHRSGDTLGEVEGTAWSSLGSLSCDSPAKPVLNVGKNARLHQIKWGTDAKNEKFRINGITLRHQPGADN